MGGCVEAEGKELLAVNAENNHQIQYSHFSYSYKY